MNVIPQRVRDGFGNLLDPLAAALIRLHVRPNLITTVGTLIVIATAAAFAVGRVRWGGALLLVSGLFDMVDGRVARRGHMITTFGAFYDSTLDRVGEGLMLGSISLVFMRDGQELALAFAVAAIGGSFLVPYARAKAEGLGIKGDVGIGSRAERVVAISAGLVLAPWGVLPWAIGILAVTAWFTVLQRILHVRRELRSSVS